MQRRQVLSFVPQAAALAALPAYASRAYAQDAGMTAKTLNIGCSAALSGPLAGFGKDLKSGIEAALLQINARGGIHGRTVQFDMTDDGYVVNRSVENVRKMLGAGNTFAMMSCLGTPNNAAIIPLIEEAGVPYVAPLTGADSLRKAEYKHVFHVRASYADETRRLVGNLVTIGIKNLVLVYLDSGFGKEVLGTALAELTRRGVKPAAQLALATDGKNLEGVIKAVMAAEPGAVFLGTAGTASVGLITALKRQSMLLPLAGLSVTLTTDGLAQLGPYSQGLALTMVMPDPNRGRTAVVREYQVAVRAAGQTSFGLGSFEAYINTRVLAAGLERAGRDLTRAKLRTALASLRNLDLGGFVLDYNAAPYVASKFVDVGVVGASGRLVG